MKEVWIAGRIARCQRDPTPLGADEESWVLLGVFSSEAEAAKVCTDCRHFISPLQIDKALSPDKQDDIPQIHPCCECYADKRQREAEAVR